MIASFVEGRVRFRHSGLKDSKVIASLKKTLLSNAGVDKVSANTKVGSLLVVYDKAATKLETVQKTIAKFLKLEITETQIPSETQVRSETQTVSPKKPAKKKTLKPIAAKKYALQMPSLQISKRRVINLGMLISFLLSVGGAILDAKTLHIFTGFAFVGMNGLHLLDKRRTLLV